jgi:hypothetical protein
MGGNGVGKLVTQISSLAVEMRGALAARIQF